MKNNFISSALFFFIDLFKLLRCQNVCQQNELDNIFVLFHGSKAALKA